MEDETPVILDDNQIIDNHLVDDSGASNLINTIDDANENSIEEQSVSNVLTPEEIVEREEIGEMAVSLDLADQENTLTKPEDQKEIDIRADEWLTFHVKVDDLDSEKKLVLDQDEQIPQELQSTIAIRLMSADDVGTHILLKRNINKFKYLDDKFIDAAIEEGSAELVTKNPESFEGNKYDSTLAHKLIENGYSYETVESSQLFHDLKLDEQLAKKIVSEGGLETVVTFRDKFEGIDFNSELLELSLQDSANMSFILDSIGMFSGINANQELFDRILGMNPEHSHNMPVALQYFKGLNLETAKLILETNPTSFYKNIGSFEDMDADKVCALIKEKIIDNDSDWPLGLACLPSSIRAEVALKLLQQEGHNIDSDALLKSFKGNSEGLTLSNDDTYEDGPLPNEVADYLISKGKIKQVADNIEIFPDLSLSSEHIDEYLAESRYDLDRVIRNISKFLPDNQNLLVIKLCNMGQASKLKNNLKYGEMNLEDDLIGKINLIDASTIDNRIETYLSAFPDVDHNDLFKRYDFS